MKSLKFFLVLMLSTAVIVGCKKKAKDGGADASADAKLTSYEKIAKGMCDCAGDLFDKMGKMVELTASGDTEALTAFQKEMEPKIKEMEACGAKLEAKYKDVDMESEEAQAKMEAAAKAYCPKLLEMGM